MRKHFLHLLMAFSILTAPDSLALSRGGRATYIFQGNAAVTVPGTKAVSGFALTGSIPDGAQITLRWNGQPKVFTARSSPALPGEFQAGPVNAGYVNALADFFRSNFYIRSDFTVSRDSLGGFESVIFTAKEPGPNYEVAASASVTVSISAAVITPGIQPVLKERYGVHVQLYKLKSGQVRSSVFDESQYEEVYRGLIEADATGKAVFDAGDMLHNEMEAERAVWAGNLSVAATTSRRDYYIAYAESYGSPLIVGQILLDEPRTVYLGGADFLNKATGYRLSQKLKGIQPSQDRALRFGPRRRYVLPDESQWLTIIGLHNCLFFAVPLAAQAFDVG